MSDSNDDPDIVKEKTVITVCSMICSTCKNSYHFTYVGSDKEKIERLSRENRSNWHCPKCTITDIDTPPEPQEDLSFPGDENEARRSATAEAGSTEKNDTPLYLISHELGKTMLSQLLTEKHLHSGNMKHHINALRKYLRDGRFDHNAIERRLAVLEEKMKTLEDFTNDFKTERNLLKSTIKRFHENNEYSSLIEMSFQVEIVGVPHDANEDLKEILLFIAEKLKVLLDIRDIDWISRVGHDDLRDTAYRQPRTIAVRFMRRNLRNDFLKAAKIYRGLTTEDLKIAGPPTQVYVNERLTRRNRYLFREARNRAKAIGLVHVWIHNGLTHIKKTGECEIKAVIRTPDDLFRYLPRPTDPFDL